ncbi:MAG TPA: ankyrin repeat domain-containing protein [Candidatus Babeliales bacterium]|nr:ankyrin repeat domain-containing protein [Candidatus Babeliales bacterium]
MKRIKLMLLGVGLVATSGLLGNVIDDIKANRFTGVNQDEANITDEDGMTPLMWASLMGNKYAADNLFRVGADIHAKDKVGGNAIIYANQEFPGSDASKKVAISIALTSRGANLGKSLEEAEEFAKKFPARAQDNEFDEALANLIDKAMRSAKVEVKEDGSVKVGIPWESLGVKVTRESPLDSAMRIARENKYKILAAAATAAALAYAGPKAYKRLGK